MTSRADSVDSEVLSLRTKSGERIGRRGEVAEKSHGRVLATRIGLQIPVGLAFEEWARTGRQLNGVVSSSSWWLGDWLVYGKDHYADRYRLGIQIAGLRYQTLRNYAWVARQFELPRRRRALSFQHHAELASLPIEDQEIWLDRAEQMKWSTKQLRNAVRFAGQRDMPPGPDVPARRLLVPGDRVEWWHKAANRAGIDFEQWVLAILDQAAVRVLEETEEQIDSAMR